MSKDVDDILYVDPSAWEPDDAWALYCFFTHALPKMGRYDYYLDAVSSIDLSRVSPEAAAILKAAMADAGGRSFLSYEFLETLDAIPVPDPPVRLTAWARADCPTARLGVLV